MTRKKLESIYGLRKDLEHWQKRYAELQADIVISPKVLDGMPFANTNAVGKPTDEKAVRLVDVTKEINKKMIEIQTTLNEIDAFLLDMKAEDAILSYIIWARCENLMEWKDIAIGCGPNYSPELVRQMYHRFVISLKQN